MIIEVICPYCGAAIDHNTKSRFNELKCIDMVHFFYYKSEDNFYLSISPTDNSFNNIQVGFGGKQYYLIIDYNQNIEVAAFKYIDCFKVIEKYLKLSAFS